MMKLYLASTSPRRKDLLERLGIPFEVVEPSFQEEPTSFSAEKEALYFAEQKALSVETQCPNSLILAADTLVECDGEKIGKPFDEKDAIKILQKLSGKTHIVLTGVVLLNTTSHERRAHLEKVLVTFRQLSQREIQDYVSSGEPFGKAGAYAIQGKARQFITQIVGEEEAAIGLPLKILKKWLKRLGT